MTPKNSAFKFVLSILFLILFGSLTTNAHVVNAVIGDISFSSRFGVMPDINTDENLRIKTHLEYVEHFLRQKDVSSLSAVQQEKRKQMLDLLHTYWSAGIFPRNYDYKDQRRPCFIDKDGRICAVGYLIEQTAGRPVAEEINRKFQYSEIFEMNDPVVEAWINTSGLTREECAMIQPTYSDPQQPINSWMPTFTPFTTITTISVGPSKKEIEQAEKIDSLTAAMDSLSTILDSTYVELRNNHQYIDSLDQVNIKNTNEIEKIASDFSNYRKKTNWIILGVSIVAVGAGSVLLRNRIRKNKFSKLNTT